MEKGDKILIVIIVLVLVFIALIVFNIGAFFPTPTPQEAIQQYAP